jgi:hypothetical protein
VSITKKLFTITISDVISMALAAVALAWFLGDFNWAAAVGIIIGNRLYSVLEESNDS